MTLQATAWGHDGGTYAGKDMRLHTAAVFGGQTGVVGSGDFLVAAQGSPNATVAVAAGALIVAATGSGLYGDYHVWNDASINSGSFAPTSTNGRKDRLILRVTSGVPALEIVQGTASASPAEPTITGDNYEELALVTLPGSTTNITNAMITDRRKRAATTAGNIICTSSTRPSAPFEGMRIIETDTDTALVYSGSAWVRVANYSSTGRVGCSVSRSTTQNATTGSLTTVTWTVEDFDPLGFIAVPSSTITIPSGYGGLYIASIDLVSGTATSWEFVEFITTARTYDHAMSGAATGNPSATMLMPMAAGDTLQIKVRQSSGSTVTMTPVMHFYRIAA